MNTKKMNFKNRAIPRLFSIGLLSALVVMNVPAASAQGLAAAFGAGARGGIRGDAAEAFGAVAARSEARSAASYAESEISGLRNAGRLVSGMEESQTVTVQPEFTKAASSASLVEGRVSGAVGAVQQANKQAAETIARNDIRMAQRQQAVETKTANEARIVQTQRAHQQAIEAKAENDARIVEKQRVNQQAVEAKAANEARIIQTQRANRQAIETKAENDARIVEKQRVNQQAIEAKAQHKERVADLLTSKKGPTTNASIEVKRPEGLTTPSRFFGTRSKPEVESAFNAKYGSPKSIREDAKTFFNSKTKRSFNVHEAADHNDGKPHVDVRRRGNYAERQYNLLTKK